MVEGYLNVLYEQNQCSQRALPADDFTIWLKDSRS